MAEYRSKIPVKTKKALVDEAGGKCANPGCPNRLIEIHHIKEWHIYKIHEKNHMIAVCPSCHDSITRGNLRIDDETAYRWKDIARRSKTNSTYLYLEPSEELPKLILGSLCVQGETNFIVFELSENNDLEFCVKNDSILLPRLRIGHEDGLLIDVEDGHVIQKDPAIEFEYRPGKVKVDDGALDERIPAWAMTIIAQDAGIDIKNQPLLDIEAIQPGVLRVKGVWIRQDFIVIVNDRQLSFIYPGLTRPLTLMGEGNGTEVVLEVKGPSVLFSIVKCA